MLNDKAIKKVEKALGVKVEDMGSGRFGCYYEGEILSWLTQRSDWTDEDSPLNAFNWHVRRADDHSDSMVDYFAGSFRSNITQLIHSVKPPAAKFSVGSLVRGKNNKRAARHGYSGDLAVVTEAGNYMRLQFVGETTAPYQTYPEKDFELC